MLLTAGVHPRVVQERLGHANITMTLGTYSHVLPHLHGEATERLTRLVFGDEWQQDGSDGPAAGDGEAGTTPEMGR